MTRPYWQLREDGLAGNSGSDAYQPQTPWHMGLTARLYLRTD
ncbi:MAG: hypothetical protein NZ772_01905 [Cyanobacteria bacterium]|nr:hypothetical protein [Cyanobacteriota bacterium]MDW8200212.1 hypothetical protein [Cyanobacteriota bacterium SKYGB_h_bin112]